MFLLILFQILMLLRLTWCFSSDYAYTNEEEVQSLKKDPGIVRINDIKELLPYLRNSRIPRKPSRDNIPPYISHLYYNEVDRYGKTIYSKWILNLYDAVILLRDRLGVIPSIKQQPKRLNPRVLSSLCIADHYANDINNATEINTFQNSTNVNNTSAYYLKKHSNRRSVLIINGDAILRSSKKGKKTESLLYEEYGDDGKKLNSFMMYNLDDVANFFKIYLDTEICHVRCEDEED